MISPPVFVEPVNATLSTPGCRTRYAPVVGPSPGTTLIDARREADLRRELGEPQRRSGVCGSGLSTTEQPAASAGRELPRRHHAAGSSTGTICAATPTGSFSV